MVSRILFIPSPVGPLGSGEGGGVETHVMTLSPFLAKKGFQVGVIAAKGSISLPGVKLYEIEGSLPPYAMTAAKDASVEVQTNGLLENIWEKAAEVQSDYDVIVAINYDWLAYFLTPFFKTPVVHWISISSTIEAVDEIIAKRYKEFPNSFAVNSQTQARTYAFLDSEAIPKMYSGVNLSLYNFNPNPEQRLCWVGRISPEKNLEDAFEVASQLNLPLDVCGKLQDEEYWQKIQARFPSVKFTYHGFLNQAELQKIIGQAQVLLLTSKAPFIEAFGNVCIDAFACGTPVVSFKGGGPDEIIKDGETGFLVDDNLEQFIEAVKNSNKLNRLAIRQYAEDNFSLEKLADRLLNWLEKAVTER